MKKMRVLGIVVPLAVVLLTQCAAGPQRGPENERRAEDRGGGETRVCSNPAT
jgi:hypothetical protein